MLCGVKTVADARPDQIRPALANRKHVLAEKLLVADVNTEWQLAPEIEASDRLVAVNLFKRNAWYRKDMQRFIAEGEIGDLAIIRIYHVTPGQMPQEGRDPEGPPFHDCGRHYVDVAHLSKAQPHNCYLDTIGTQGVARMFGMTSPRPLWSYTLLTKSCTKQLRSMTRSGM